MYKFRVKTEDMAFPLGRVIQREQEAMNMSNIKLARLVGCTDRQINRLKNGGNVSLRLIEKVLFELGLEVTAQPIGADFKEE